MNKLRAWFLRTWGRVTTVVGAASLSIDVFDVAPVQKPLADLIGDSQAKKLLGAVALICLAISFIRHNMAAAKVKDLRQQLHDSEERNDAHNPS